MWRAHIQLRRPKPPPSLNLQPPSSPPHISPTNLFQLTCTMLTEVRQGAADGGLHQEHLLSLHLPPCLPPPSAPPLLTCTMLGCARELLMAASIKSIFSRFSSPDMDSGRMMVLTATCMGLGLGWGWGKGGDLGGGEGSTHTKEKEDTGLHSGARTQGRQPRKQCAMQCNSMPPYLSAVPGTSVHLAKRALSQDLVQLSVVSARVAPGARVAGQLLADLPDAVCAQRVRVCVCRVCCEERDGSL